MKINAHIITLPFPTHTDASECDRWRRGPERRENASSVKCKCGDIHKDVEVMVQANGGAHNFCPTDALYHRLRDPAAARLVRSAWYDEASDVWAGYL